MRLSSYDTLSKLKQVPSTLMVSVYYLMTGLEEALVESKGEIEILQEKVSSLSVQLLTGKTYGLSMCHYIKLSNYLHYLQKRTNLHSQKILSI